jgi:enoyl-CoA hydratase/carnithine racemase
VARAELDAAALAVAEQLAAQPPDAVRAAKEALARGMELPLEQALRLEALLAGRLRDNREGTA